MKNRQTFRKNILAIAISGLLGTGLPLCVMAAPQNGQVSAGQGTISTPNANTTQIQQNSHNLVLDWSSFNVSAQEQVNFLQPSSTAAALNNIHDQNPSQILGAINANGRVFLSNPNGLVFGPNSTVNVNSLVAAGLDIDANAFMNGQYNLQALQDAGSVINYGLINAATGGSVALLGSHVANHGKIIANYGHVALASGRQMVLDFDGDGLINFQVNSQLLENAENHENSVHNTGEIRADAGQIVLEGQAAAEVFTNVVNNEGLLQANSIQNVGGVIRLQSSGRTLHIGEIDASGLNTNGGEVQVLGDQVGLFGTASIDTSGSTGGGVVLIGGDFQGNNDSIQNASQTIIGSEASIHADALDRGDGGKVIVWADNTTHYYGNITAQGGEVSGDGGFVEVSGKGRLNFSGEVDTTAINGNTGMLLLDPTDITIQDGGTTDIESTTSAGTETFQETDTVAGPPLTPSNTSILTVSSLETALDSNNVIVTTDSTASAPNGGRITVSDNIVSTTSNNLELVANENIVINANITTSGGDVTLTAANNIAAGSATIDTSGADSNSGAASAAGDVQITATDGSITVGTINAIGGNATNPNGTSGGAGGIIALTVTDAEGTNRNITIGQGGSLNSSGGNSRGANTAGDAGTITLQVLDPGGIEGDGSITVIGSITANGGDIQNGSAGTPGSGGDIELTANGATNSINIGTVIVNPITVDLVANAGAAGATGGNITLTSNAIDILHNVADTDNNTFQTTGILTLQPLDAATTMSFGGTSTFDLSTTEIADLTGTDSPTTIIIGDAANSSGVMSIGAPVNLTGKTLTLNAGSFSDGNTTTNIITSNTLTLNASNDSIGATALDNEIDTTVTTLSVNTQGSNNAALINTGSLDLASSSVGGDLSVTADGAITDSGALIVNGAGASATFAAGAANNVTLDAANDFTTVAITSALDVTLNDINSIDLGASNISGNLDVTANGAITDSGALIVNGAGASATFAAGAANNVTLDAANDFTTVAITNALDVTLNDINSIDLGSSNISGIFSVTAPAGITDSGDLSVTLGSTFTANTAGSSIILDSTGSNFAGTVTFSSTGGLANVTIDDDSALDLQTLTLTGNLNVTANGAITDSGALIVNGAGASATFAAGVANNVTLDAANDFTTVAITNALDVTLNDINSIDLGASNISGIFSVTANGAITDSGALIVNGAGASATFAAGAANNVTLDAANDFTTVAITNALDVTLNDINSIDLGASTVSGIFNVTANGAITDSAALVVNGAGATATFAAGATNNITLDATNDFTTVAITNALDVTLIDINSIDLGASSVSGIFNVTANGAITDSAALVVNGASATFAAGAANNVTLDAANDFTTVAITNALDVTLNDINSIDLGASTVSGNLNATAPGGITDSGDLSVTLGSIFTANTTGSSIILDSTGSNFAGTVTFASTGGLANVTIDDNSALDLQALSLTGNLNVTADGTITDSGALIVNGAGASATFAAGAANNVTLDAANDFTTVAITNALDVTLNDINSIDLGASTVSGIFNVTANGAITDSAALVVNGASATFAAGAANNVTLDAANDFTTVAITNALDVTLNDINSIDLGASTVSGNLNVTAPGGITDSGNLSVTLGSIFTANTTGSSIILDSTGSNFAGTVTFASTGDLANVTIDDNSALDLQALSLTGNLNVTADGTITDSGALVVNGAGANATFAAGATNNVTLDAANDFTTVAITNALDVTLNDINSIDLGASTVSGNLNVTAPGGITDSGDLSVTLGSIFTANTAGSSIILDSTGSNFAGTVTFASTGGLANVTIDDNSALDLQALSLTGNLNVTADGTITDSGALVVNGAGANATFAAGAANNVTLDAANDFTTVAITNALDVTLNDINSIDLGASTVSGNLNVTAPGGITDSGDLSVTLGSIFTANTAGSSIILDSTGSNFAGTVTFASTGGLANVTIDDNSALDLQALSLTGNLNVTADGTITDSGALVVNGAGANATFAAGAANNVTLDAANDFTTVAITNALDVTLNDINSIDLGASTVSGIFNVTANGAITDSAALVVNGASATFAAGAANNVTLDAANDFTTVAITNALDVTLNDINSIDLGASTVSGNLNVTAPGGITDSGNLSVTLGSIFTANTTGSSIILDSTGSNFAGTVTFASTGGLANVTIDDNSALDLQALSLTNDLTVTANGAITQSAGLTVGGLSNFSSGANAITLDNTANDFTGALSLSNSGANAVSVTDTNAIQLGLFSLGTGSLTINAVGITQSGDITQTAGASNATFNAGAGVITLDNIANDFTGTVLLSNSDPNAVSVTDANALDLGVSNIGGNLNVLATNANLSVSGDLTSDLDINLQTTGTGNIIFDDGITLKSTTGKIDLSTADPSIPIIGRGSGTFTAGNGLVMSTDISMGGTTVIDVDNLNIQRNITTASGNLSFTKDGLITVPAVVLAAEAGTINMPAFQADGELNITAGTGVNLNGAVTTLDSNSTLTIDAGNGSLDLTNDTVVLTAAGNVDITASDIEFDPAAVLEVTGQFSLSDQATGNGIGLGLDQPNKLNLSRTEYSQIVADSILVKSANSITLENFSPSEASTVSLTIDSPSLDMKGGSTINFAGDLDFANSSVDIQDGGTLIIDVASFAMQGDLVATNTVDIRTGKAGTVAGTGINMGADSSITTNGGAITLAATSGDILVGELNAGNANVFLTATGPGADILNSRGVFLDVTQSLTNVLAQNVTLIATDRIGASSTDAITLDISENGLISLQFGATTAFINNLRNSKITNLDGSGTVAVGLIFSDQILGIGHNLGLTATQEPSLSVEVAPGEEKQSSDISILGMDFLALLGEDEEEDFISSILPSVPVMIRTLKGWRFESPSRQQILDQSNQKRKDGYKYIDWF